MGYWVSHEDDRMQAVHLIRWYTAFKEVAEKWSHITRYLAMLCQCILMMQRSILIAPQQAYHAKRVIQIYIQNQIN